MIVDIVVVAVGPHFSGFMKKHDLLTNIPMYNEIHAHCLFKNSSLSESLPLTFFGEVWKKEEKRENVPF